MIRPENVSQGGLTITLLVTCTNFLFICFLTLSPDPSGGFRSETRIILFHNSTPTRVLLQNGSTIQRSKPKPPAPPSGFFPSSCRTEGQNTDGHNVGRNMASARPPLTELFPWFKGAPRAPIDQDDAVGWPFRLAERNLCLSESLRYQTFYSAASFFEKKPGCLCHQLYFCL